MRCIFPLDSPSCPVDKTCPLVRLVKCIFSTGVDLSTRTTRKTYFSTRIMSTVLDMSEVSMSTFLLDTVKFASGRIQPLREMFT